MTSAPPNTSKFILACVQPTAADTVAVNIDEVGGLISRAADEGAQFVATPETCGLMEMHRDALFEKIRPQEDDAALKAWCRLARDRRIWLLIGSLMIRLSDRQAANRSFLIDDAGDIRATYDKLHMFDVDLGEGERYQESQTYRPGTKAVVADTPWGRLGMSICYDLRFAYLYRALALAGAEMLAVPAAFTVPTGEAHWHTLLRARAIDTGAFVFAPAQTGHHATGRKTYGHSLIVDPWGKVLADGGQGKGAILSEIDMARVAEVRRNVPALSHTRGFEGPL
jgi:predicted amidohydrolase